MNSIRSAIENTIPITQFNPSTTISQEQVDQEFGFTASDYENTDDIEFE